MEEKWEIIKWITQYIEKNPGTLGERKARERHRKKEEGERLGEKTMIQKDQKDQRERRGEELL